MTQDEELKAAQDAYHEASEHYAMVYGTCKAAQDAYHEASEHYAMVYGTYKGASKRLKKAMNIYRAELTRINQN